MNILNRLKSLASEAKLLVEAEIALLKLKTVSKLAGLISSIVSLIIVVFIISFIFVILNIGIALWLGKLTGETYYGFFIVAGIYTFLGIMLSIFGKKWIKNLISNFIIKKLLDEQ